MDLYEILLVAEDASRAEIRAAYLVLVQESHPDRRHVAPDPAELARFKRIQEAFETLHDPARRAEYDRIRGRPLLQHGHVVVTPVGTGFRRDIPTHWLHRTGSSRRSKRRLGRWILLALVLAMVVAFLAQRQFFWPRLSSRATNVPPAARPAPRAAQVAILPTHAPIEAQDAMVEKDQADVLSVDPEGSVVGNDHAQASVDAPAADPPSVDELLARSSWHPAMLDSVALPPAMYPLNFGELARFEAANYDAVVTPASWHVEEWASVLSAYSSLTPDVPWPDVTVAELLDTSDSHHLWNTSMADTPVEAMVPWQMDDLSVLPFPDWPLGDEMPFSMMREPPSLGATAFPYADAAMRLDLVDRGRSVNVAIPVELFPVSNASGHTPPAHNPKPYRQKSRATNKWETAPWNASQDHRPLESRTYAPQLSRRHISSHNQLDSPNWSASSVIRSPMSSGMSSGTSSRIRPAYLPRVTSPTVVTWSTSPASVNVPATGIRSEPNGFNKANQFELAPLSPVPRAGESFYYRRDLGPYDSP